MLPTFGAAAAVIGVDHSEASGADRRCHRAACRDRGRGCDRQTTAQTQDRALEGNALADLAAGDEIEASLTRSRDCLLYTSPSPRD